MYDMRPENLLPLSISQLVFVLVIMIIGQLDDVDANRISMSKSLRWI